VKRDITTATGEVGEAHAAPLVAVPTTEAEVPRREAAEAAMQRPVSSAVVPPDVWALAWGTAAVLGETLPPPVRIITPGGPAQRKGRWVRLSRCW